MQQLKFVSFLLTLCFACNAGAWCEIYKVKEGDTYSKISKHYFKETGYAAYLSAYNKDRELTPGTKVPFFIPMGHADWATGCQNWMVARLTKKNAHKNMEQFLYGVPDGIQAVAILLGGEDLDPMLSLDLCAISLAVAEAATHYGLKKPSKGRVGVYGFEPQVAIDILKKHGLIEELKKSKIPVTRILESVGDMTVVFVIRYSMLYAQNKNMGKTLIEYFGEDGRAMSLYAYAAYLEIMCALPYTCTLEDAR